MLMFYLMMKQYISSMDEMYNKYLKEEFENK